MLFQTPFHLAKKKTLTGKQWSRNQFNMITCKIAEYVLHTFTHRQFQSEHVPPPYGHTRYPLIRLSMQNYSQQWDASSRRGDQTGCFHSSILAFCQKGRACLDTSLSSPAATQTRRWAVSVDKCFTCYR